jgi:hypothetical protein
VRFFYHNRQKIVEYARCRDKNSKSTRIRLAYGGMKMLIVCQNGAIHGKYKGSRRFSRYFAL